MVGGVVVVVIAAAVGLLTVRALDEPGPDGRLDEARTLRAHAALGRLPPTGGCRLVRRSPRTQAVQAAVYLADLERDAGAAPMRSQDFVGVYAPVREAVAIRRAWVRRCVKWLRRPDPGWLPVLRRLGDERPVALRNRHAGL